MLSEIVTDLDEIITETFTESLASNTRNDFNRSHSSSVFWGQPLSVSKCIVVRIQYLNSNSLWKAIKKIFFTNIADCKK